MDMYYRPVLQPSQGQSSLLLMNKSKPNGKNMSVSMDLELSFTNTRRDKNNSVISTIASSKRGSLTERKSKTEEAKRQYLNKVLINRMINTRLAFKLIQEIPVQLSKRGPSFEMAKSLIFKTKLNLQTSMLRTLIYASEKKQISNNKLKYDRGQNVFILPSNSKADLSKQRNAILQLTELIKNSLKQAVKKFQYNLKRQKILLSVFNKICSHVALSKEITFLKIKLTPYNKNEQSKVTNQQQLKIFRYILNHQYLSKMKQAMNELKMYNTVLKLQQVSTAKTIVTFSKFRREMFFKQWIDMAKKQKQQQLEQTQIEKDKIQAINRITKKKYLKVLKHIARKIATFKKVAVQVGAYTKINEQKSLWRLLVHAQKSQNE